MNAEQYYKDVISGLNRQVARLVRRSNLLVACKLLFFCCIVAAVWLAVSDGAEAWEVIALVLSLVVYVVALRVDARCKRQIDSLRARIKVCTDELSCLANDFSPFDDGTRYVDLQHEYSYDLDIFGPQSLFNRLDRTVTLKGKDLLAQRLKELSTDGKLIARRQEAIKEMSEMTEWRIRFISNEHIGKELDKLSDTAGQAEVKGVMLKTVLPYVIVVVTALTLVAWIAGLVSSTVFGTMFIAQLAIAAMSGRQTDRAMQMTGNLYDECKRYLEILKDIEAADFHSDELCALRQSLFDSQTGSYAAFRKLAGILNKFDQRGNFLMYFLLNGLMMYDIFITRMFLRWTAQYCSHVKRWTDIISEIDVFVSLGTYAFNNQDSVYATVLDGSSDVIVDAVDIIHPFLTRSDAVANSFTLSRHNISIITGANMAGKSTFLRTIGVSFILAANGVPVAAKAFSFVPVSLFSSMRTTDNLSKDISYFQAELLRLRQMLEHIKSHDYTLIILDEILKGTNSQDKLKGSLLVLNTLSGCEVSGIIATHDLEIARLEETDAARFSNYCFEIELSDRIRYTYKMRHGVARNMNASYLIQKMLDEQRS